jgi:hypothetical protein
VSGRPAPAPADTLPADRALLIDDGELLRPRLAPVAEGCRRKLRHLSLPLRVQPHPLRDTAAAGPVRGSNLRCRRHVDTAACARPRRPDDSRGIAPVAASGFMMVWG